MLKGAQGRPPPLGWAASALALAFVGLNAALLGHTGIRFGGDTVRYTSGPERVLAGLPLDGFQWAYAAYIAVVAAVRGLGGDLATVVPSSWTAAFPSRRTRPMNSRRAGMPS